MHVSVVKIMGGIFFFLTNSWQSEPFVKVVRIERSQFVHQCKTQKSVRLATYNIEVAEILCKPIHILIVVCLNHEIK